jgi:hypothetical protein
MKEIWIQAIPGFMPRWTDSQFLEVHQVIDILPTTSTTGYNQDCGRTWHRYKRSNVNI